MARRFNSFSFNRRDRKLLGVCSTLGDVFAIDPTLLRIGFVAVGLFVGFQFAGISYAALAIYFAMKRKQRRSDTRMTDYERMDYSRSVRPSIHALRTELDPIDRRLMAIDAHISKPNDELAREIEALREVK